MHELLTKNFLANYQDKESKWLGVFPTQSNVFGTYFKVIFSTLYNFCSRSMYFLSDSELFELLPTNKQNNVRTTFLKC